MKRILAASVALAMGTVVAHATDFGSSVDPSILSSQPFSGHLELYGQGAWQDYWSDNYSPWKGIGGASRLNWWIAPTMSAQFDFAGQYGVESYESYYSTFSLYGAAHLSKRTDRYLIGVFGGLAGTSSYEGYEGWNTSLFGGFEGQWYSGPFTVYGQVGLIAQLAGYYFADYPFAFPFAQVEGRYFITPNTKLSANIGVVSGDVWNVPQTTVSYGAELEHKFTSNPFSLFARWQGFNGSGYYGINGYRLMAGARLNWGFETLQDQDRRGATLKVMEDLAPIGDQYGFD